MPRQAITFNEFSGGELGYEAPSFKNRPNSYRAINVWRYQNGSIGPRPPITRVTTTGTLSSKAIQVFNIVPGFGYMVFVYSDGTSQTLTFPSFVVTTHATPFPFLPTDSVVSGQEIFYVSNLGTGAKFNAVDIVSLPNLPRGLRIERFKQRFVVSGDGTGFNYTDIRFSAVNDGTTWPAANTFQVTPQGIIADLWVQRNSLLVVDHVGRLYRIDGTLGVNETLQQVDIIPQYPTTFGVLVSPYWAGGGPVLSGDVWYKSGHRVVNFSGAQSYTLPGIPRPSFKPPIGVSGTVFTDSIPYLINGMDDDEFIWATYADSTDGNPVSPYDQIGLTWHHTDGTFSQHLVPVTAYTPDGAKPPVVGGVSATSRRLILAASNGTAGPPQVYTQLLGSDFPEAGSDGDSGAPVQATLTTSDWMAPGGSEVVVNAVILDYSAMPGTVPASLDLTVEAINPVDSNEVRTNAAVTFAPSVGSAYPDYNLVERGRKTFNMGEQGASGGFRIKIENWYGMQINEIIAIVSTQEARV